MQVIQRNSSSSISIIVNDGDATFQDACVLAVSFRFGRVRPTIFTTKSQLATGVRYDWRFSWLDNNDRGYATDLIKEVAEKVKNDWRLTDSGRKRLLAMHGQEWTKVQNWPVGELP